MIERTLQTLPDVVEVRASERRGEVEIFSAHVTHAPSFETIRDALVDTGYSVLHSHTAHRVHEAADGPDARHWMEVGGILVLIIAGYSLLKGTGVFEFSPATEDAASLTTVFLVGLVAASSTCLAVVGGLLLSVSAAWCDAFHPTTRWEKFQPLLSFNAGRLAGYFVLGGLVGLLGTALTLSPATNGLLSIAVAVVMLGLGLNILRILPKRYCTFPLPRAMRARISRLAQSRSPLAPMALGALTFFLPCGFTQSMQLLALASGGFFQGGMIMLVFALGTLPALLGLSVMSSLAEGTFARFFLKFSGVLVVLLGLLNIQSGLILNGIDVSQYFHTSNFFAAGRDPYVTISEKGDQVISIEVSNQGYSPASVTIRPGIRTWVYARAPQSVSGCGAMMVATDFNLSTPIVSGRDNWLGPIENPQKDFLVTCSMGMMRTSVHISS
jgi:sulfite exporter TauE/SafE